MKKIIITDAEPEFNFDSESLAKIVTARLGLLPRKKGSNDYMHKILLELYERSKKATREKNPEFAVMTVEEMAIFAGITKQTMYEYLERWTSLDFLTKATFLGSDKKIIKGYKLNGNTLEEAYKKVQSNLNKIINDTEKYIVELQKIIKNEKIRETMKKQDSEN